MELGVVFWSIGYIVFFVYLLYKILRWDIKGYRDGYIWYLFKGIFLLSREIEIIYNLNIN